MKILRVLFLIIFIQYTNSSFANDVYGMIGKTVLLSGNIGGIGDYMYNQEAYQKKKYNNKNHFTTSIIGKPILVKDVFLYDEGKEYKESCCIVFEFNGDIGVIKIPLYIPMGEAHPFCISKMDNKLSRLSKGLCYRYKISDIIINYCDFSEILSYDEMFAHQTLIPKNSKISPLKQNVKYEYLGYKVSGNSCMALFSNMGQVIQIPFKSSEFLENLLTETDYIKENTSHIDSTSIDTIKRKYVGKEIYVSVGNYCFYTIDSISLPFPKCKSEIYNKGDKFYQCVDFLLMLPYENTSSKLNYYAIVFDEAKNEYLAISSGLFESNNHIQMAVDRRAYEAKMDEEYAREQRERQEKADKDNAIYINDLAKHYGRKNALAIFNNEVEIGFTKEMCRESWGNPSLTRTGQSKSGSYEIWIYDTGQYLYFKGNKLVSIEETE